MASDKDFERDLKQTIKRERGRNPDKESNASLRFLVGLMALHNLQKNNALSLDDAYENLLNLANFAESLGFSGARQWVQRAGEAWGVGSSSSIDLSSYDSASNWPEGFVATKASRPDPNALRIVYEGTGPDGKTVKIVHEGGHRSARNNNPGNLEYGDFARRHGALGSDGRFAIFPSPEHGLKAMESLLFETSSYRNRTIAGAITRYAPHFENDTGSYISRVARAAGVSPHTRMSSLSPDQRERMIKGMMAVEGQKQPEVHISGLSTRQTTAPDFAQAADGNVVAVAGIQSPVREQFLAAHDGGDSPKGDEPTRAPQETQVASATQTAPPKPVGA